MVRMDPYLICNITFITCNSLEVYLSKFYSMRRLVQTQVYSDVMMLYALIMLIAFHGFVDSGLCILLQIKYGRKCASFSKG